MPLCADEPVAERGFSGARDLAGIALRSSALLTM
jgi:hypothetical protein